MTSLLAIAVDLLVATLLVATIATSLRLSRRMARMKADETAMRSTIADLVAATETAERAVATLRATLTESDRTLGEQLRAAERQSADLASRVEAGETVMARIARIVEVSRKTGAPSGGPDAGRPPARQSDLARAAAAARQLAERAARRLDAQAA